MSTPPHNTANKTKLCIISGPTGIGKTSLSLRLATDLHTSIISADSVQCYRRLDIGSNKVDAAVRQQIPHYCIDIYDLVNPQGQANTYTVADWLTHTNAAITDITQSDTSRIPVVVGGAGLHLRWLLYGAAATPKSTSESKQHANQLMTQLLSNTLTAQQLYDTLQCTPESGAWLHQVISEHNPVRIERCIEILSLNQGVKPSDYTDQSTQPRTSLDRDIRAFYLFPVHKAWLQRLVNYRCELMIQQGLIQEVLALQQYGMNDTLSSLAIGYRQTIDFIAALRLIDSRNDQRRIACFKQYVEKLQSATRQYVRRQGTWFRNEPLYDFVPVYHNVSEQYDKLTADEKVRQLMLPDNVIGDLQTYVSSQLSMPNDIYTTHVQSNKETQRQADMRELSKSSNDKSVRYLQSECLIYGSDNTILQLLNSIPTDSG